MPDSATVTATTEGMRGLKGKNVLVTGGTSAARGTASWNLDWTTHPGGRGRLGGCLGGLAG